MKTFLLKNTKTNSLFSSKKYYTCNGTYYVDHKYNTREEAEEALRVTRENLEIDKQFRKWQPTERSLVEWELKEVNSLEIVEVEL